MKRFSLHLKPVLTGLLLFSSVRLDAFDYDWMNAVNGVWSDTTKWSPTGAPGSTADNVTIDATGTAYQINITSAVTINDITLDSADATLAFSGPTGSRLTVNDFTFSAGLLDLTRPSDPPPHHPSYPVERFTVQNGTFEFNGGTIDGPVFIRGGHLGFGSSSSGSGKFHLFDAGNTMSNAVPEDLELDIWAYSSVTVDGNFTNAGNVKFTNGLYSPLDLTVLNGVLNNVGTMTVWAGAVGGSEPSFNLNSDFTNTGTLTVGGDGVMFGKENAVYTNRGEITIDNGPWIFVKNGATFVQESGVFNGNGGYLRVEDGGTVDLKGGTVTGPYPVFLRGGGSVKIRPEFTDAIDILISGSGNTFAGDLGVGQQLLLTLFGGPDPSLTSNGFTNGGEITIDPGSRFTISGGVLANTGTVRMNGFTGYSQYLTGDFTNNGVFEVVGPNAVLDKPNGDYLNNANFTINGKLVVSNNGSLWNGTTGTLQGTGIMEIAAGSSFTNAGTIAPGLSPGTLTIQGDVTLENSSVLEIELGSISTYDLLQIMGGEIFLDGLLEITLLNGFIPDYGDIFTVLTADDISGSFDNLSGNIVGVPGGAFEVVQNGNQVQLVHFVPEPSSLLLLLFGAGVCTKRRRFSSGLN